VTLRRLSPGPVTLRRLSPGPVTLRRLSAGPVTLRRGEPMAQLTGAATTAGAAQKTAISRTTSDQLRPARTRFPSP
jgi:hypothetical protein